jgi:hypothetical protein
MSSNPPKATPLINRATGQQVGTIYDFKAKGDCLAQHSHQYDVDDHFTVLAKGAVRVSSGPQDDPANFWSDDYAETGPVLDHKPFGDSKFVVHEFTALKANTRIVNIRKGLLLGEPA